MSSVLCRLLDSDAVKFLNTLCKFCLQPYRHILCLDDDIMKTAKERIFSELIQKYFDMVSRTSFRILCDSEDSKAVVTDVFTYVWKHMEHYDPSIPLHYWILSATCRMSRLRIARRRMLYIFGKRPGLYFTSSPKVQDQDDYITKQAWEIYCRVSERLTAGQRMLFALCVLDDVPHEDAVSLTGIPMFRVSFALHRAEEKVKKELERFGKIESYPQYIKFLRKVIDDNAEKEVFESYVTGILQLPVP